MSSPEKGICHCEAIEDGRGNLNYCGEPFLLIMETEFSIVDNK